MHNKSESMSIDYFPRENFNERNQSSVSRKSLYNNRKLLNTSNDHAVDTKHSISRHVNKMRNLGADRSVSNPAHSNVNSFSKSSVKFYKFNSTVENEPHGNKKESVRQMAHQPAKNISLRNSYNSVILSLQ